jgi:Holliday junction resolvase-like predicted endonuclease
MNRGHGTAGKGARDLANRRYLSRQKYVLPLLLICGALLIFAVSVSSHSNLGFGALIFPLIAVVLFKAIGRRIDQSVKEERRAVRGAKGEELIGAMLEGLGDRFLVFHDLPSPYGNIDHLVVSKQTVFLVETKAHGGRVNVVNGQIQVNQRPPEKDFIAQVVRNTAWLSAQLEEKLGTKIWIKPILVFTNAYVENPCLIRNIHVIPKAFLLNTILKSSRSDGAWKLWENNEVLAEIFPTICFPPKADLNPPPSTLSPSPHLKAGSSLELPTSSVPKNASLLSSPHTAPTLPKELPSPIRRTPMGAIYRLGSADDQKPNEVKKINREDK